MNIYKAFASRDGKYWLVHIPQLDQYTQARTLAEAEPMARELISLVQGVPEDSFELEWHNQLSDSVLHHLELARKYAGEAAWYQAEAANERRFAARAMRAEGMTVRDIGAALGVSHQRAQQLISSSPLAHRKADLWGLRLPWERSSSPAATSVPRTS